VTAPFRAGEVAGVRRQIDVAARRAGLVPATAESLVIAANELMTNAVRHGGGSGLLRLWVDGDVICEVIDRGPGFAAATYQDRTERPTPTRWGGMGLWIAQQTTDALSIDSGPAGTRVQVVVGRRTTGSPR
jgi:anti-sigma regulatory factor (Ser/Thr protein kinase)